jgi:hypothetical protein
MKYSKNMKMMLYFLIMVISMKCFTVQGRDLLHQKVMKSLGTLAPLWLNEQIPNYFVIFRLDNPAAVNNFRAATPNANFTNAQTSAEFNKNVLENCTAIKTFDLTEGTALGSYIRNYRNQETFPEVPLNMTWRKDEPILWNGISYKVVVLQVR